MCCNTRDAYTEFEEILQDIKGQARKTVELRILEYLRDNTKIGIPLPPLSWGVRAGTHTSPIEKKGVLQFQVQ